MPPPDDWTDWDMWEGFCSLDEFLRAVNGTLTTTISKTGNTRTLPLIPKAMELLKKRNKVQAITGSCSSMAVATGLMQES